MRRWLRPISLLLLTAAFGCTAAKANPNLTPRDLSQWAAVKSVAPGAMVEVVGDSGAVERGELTAADDTGITISVGPDLKIIPQDNVREVAVIQRGGDSLKNGALIGAAAAVGYAVIVLTIVAKGDDVDASSIPAGMLITGGIGAAIGAWIDSARSGTRRVLIYRRMKANG